MKSFRAAALLLPLLVPIPVISAEPTDPLAYVPDVANLLFRVENPRKLAETIRGLDAYQQLTKLPLLRDQFESPTFQRFFQLVSYYEQELGMPWPEMLDKVAGGGITFAAKVNEPTGVVLIFHGRDETAVKTFFTRAVSVIEQELARAESNEKIQKKTIKGCDAVQFTKDLVALRAGAMIAISNKSKALEFVLAQYTGEKRESMVGKPGPMNARKAVPADSMAWGWFDLEIARSAPNAKEIYALPANDILQLLLAGSSLNAIKRAPFLAAAIHPSPTGLTATIRLPGGGRTGLPEGLSLHVPPAKDDGALPLINVPGAIFSQSFYLDQGALWEKRKELLNETLVKQFEEGNKGSRFLPGTSLSKMLTQAGPHHRIVVAQRDELPYKDVTPAQRIPAIAIVNSIRDPAFGKSMDGVLRAVALFAGAQVNLKLVEEDVNGIKLVGYRFPVSGKFPNDPDNLRFNFSPCFAVVGDQFLAASTLEFGREMIGVLKNEKAAPATAPVNWRARVIAAGVADLAKAFEDQLLAQLVLDQAIAPAEAKKQAASLMDWIKQLGALELRIEHHEKEYRFDFDWRFKK
jgi:hypothetical protein